MKQVLLDRRAKKELGRFPRSVELKFKALFEILEEKGKLEQPYAKKLSGSSELFELRVAYGGSMASSVRICDKEQYSNTVSFC